jgi:hypothetical protein
MEFYNLFEELQQHLSKNGFNINTKAPDIPDDVQSFLGELSILYDVPTHYLIPDEKLLPKYFEKKDEHGQVLYDEQWNVQLEEWGALRVFRIDPYWVYALLNGALTIGPSYNSPDIFKRNADSGLPKINISQSKDTKQLLRKAMNGDFLAQVFQKELIAKVRDQMGSDYDATSFKREFIKRLKNLGFEVEDDTDLNQIPTAPPSIAQQNWRYSGFFFRSSLISTWQDLEVVAYGKVAKADREERILQVLRMEKLATDTILYICEGIITRVLIKQPPESFHFGVEAIEAKKITVEKRVINELVEVKEKQVDENGDQKKHSTKQLERVDRVLNIKVLAEQLNASGSSAALAKELIEKPIHNAIGLEQIEKFHEMIEV